MASTHLLDTIEILDDMEINDIKTESKPGSAASLLMSAPSSLSQGCDELIEIIESETSDVIKREDAKPSFDTNRQTMPLTWVEKHTTNTDITKTPDGDAAYVETPDSDAAYVETPDSDAAYVKTPDGGAAYVKTPNSDN